MLLKSGLNGPPWGVPSSLASNIPLFIRIDYRPGAEAPGLSVRLQECFGMTETPTVNDGKQPLLMELLSPGFKPVQLTQDLASFGKVHTLRLERN